MYNYYSNPMISNCSFSGNSVSRTCVPDHCWGGTGGAIYNELSSPMITDCVFTGNYAHVGGGLFNDESDALVQFCSFSENFASSSHGGGMCNDWSSPTVYECVFTKNRAFLSGGGMVNSYGMPLVADCLFSENSSAGSGGGIYNIQSSGTIMRCIFAGNSSSNNRGGGMLNILSRAMLTNCVFAGNSAKSFGGAVENMRCQSTIVNCTVVQNRSGEAGGGVQSGWGVDALVKNSILWANAAPDGPQIAARGSSSESDRITVEYSAVMGGREGVTVGPNDALDWGSGNIDCDPCFADMGYWDPNGTPEDANDDYWVMGDYHLKSQAGRWDPNSQAWVIDDVTSPCIDAGDPMSPIGIEPFPNGGRVNMGAYGGTSEASKSYFDVPACETIVAGDINGDCRIDFSDFTILAAHWLERVTPRPESFEDYLPLSVGNSWTYVDCNDGSTRTFTIIGTEEINGHI